MNCLLIDGAWINLAQVALIELFPPRTEDSKKQIPPTVIFKFVDSQTKIVHGDEAIAVLAILISSCDDCTPQSGKTVKAFLESAPKTKGQITVP